jgi:hypothetical protein
MAELIRRFGLLLDIISDRLAESRLIHEKSVTACRAVSNAEQFIGWILGRPADQNGLSKGIAHD